MVRGNLRQGGQPAAGADGGCGSRNRDSHFGEKPSILKGWRRGGKATLEKAFGL
jgi:hypothetical protein